MIIVLKGRCVIETEKQLLFFSVSNLKKSNYFKNRDEAKPIFFGYKIPNYIGMSDLYLSGS